MVGMKSRLKVLYLKWRSRCPFVRKLEAWRMKRRAKEFKVKL
ncbi:MULTISPECIES: hypothetical protein [Thermococcus]|nr:hypothetical protein [Thermococcus kodakarensis]WCN29489.1 hypothetical protein POG15_07975 [Thermococcus kodakarensis]WCN31771.1 hypothetical protein POG21_07965 [Thermococcus kodakarensis]